MAIFTTYLALTRIGIPKEKYEYIDILPSQVAKAGSSVLIPYISIFRLGFRRKYAFSFGRKKKFSCSMGSNIFAMSHKEVSQFQCVYMELKSNAESKEVSSPQLSKTLQTQKQEANTPISERLGIDVGL